MDTENKNEIVVEDIANTEEKAPITDNMDAETVKTAEQETEKAPADKKKEMWRVIKFLLFSLSAGGVQLGVSTLCWEVFNLSTAVGYAIALACSVVWNFTFNRKFTFKAANNVPIAMLKVAAYYAVFGPASYFGVDALANAMEGINETLVDFTSEGVFMVINLVTEFLYQKYFVFRNAIDTNKKKDNQDDEKTAAIDGTEEKEEQPVVDQKLLEEDNQAQQEDGCQEK